ncbi:hypothetical protein OsJ_19483 [Oryza sativa Japonica Group]|uniref:Uncharacterized protein n=1 Tax=Oryza sativa subsp. japonica TaxID=39947 RepID=B9FHV9_ORYSJ|nr:hypothetical protein OsJ_19483 [Oryza sativa Japonica Group]
MASAERRIRMWWRTARRPKHLWGRRSMLYMGHSRIYTDHYYDPIELHGQPPPLLGVPQSVNGEETEGIGRRRGGSNDGRRHGEMAPET